MAGRVLGLRLLRVRPFLWLGFIQLGDVKGVRQFLEVLIKD